MSVKTLAALLITAVVIAMGPSAVAEEYGTDCSDPATYHTTYDDVQCKTIAGPVGATMKALPVFGIAICSDESGSPFPCNGPANRQHVGAAIFDPSAWSSGPKTVQTWVTYLGDGACGFSATCGYDVLLCNDRDNDGFCSGFFDDEVYTTQSNEPLEGADCTDAEKDDKDCPDPYDAEVGGCMNPAFQPPATADWNARQIVVFIGTWADAWPGDTGTSTNIGSGVAAGHFDVWLAMTDGCDPACSDGWDNDGDYLTDFPNDPDCDSSNDNSESAPSPLSRLPPLCAQIWDGEALTTYPCLPRVCSVPRIPVWTYGVSEVATNTGIVSGKLDCSLADVVTGAPPESADVQPDGFWGAAGSGVKIGRPLGNTLGCVRTFGAGHGPDFPTTDETWWGVFCALDP